MEQHKVTELTNKIRWAIGSSLDSSESFKLHYREQMYLASIITDDVLGVLSALRARSSSSERSTAIDRKLLRNLLTQVELSD